MSGRESLLLPRLIELKMNDKGQAYFHRELDFAYGIGLLIAARTGLALLAAFGLNVDSDHDDSAEQLRLTLEDHQSEHPGARLGPFHFEPDGHHDRDFSDDRPLRCDLESDGHFESERRSLSRIDPRFQSQKSDKIDSRNAWCDREAQNLQLSFNLQLRARRNHVGGSFGELFGGGW